MYAGADQTFTPELTGSVRVGAQFVDFYNEGTTHISPYADAFLNYCYMKGSWAQLGIKQIRNASDLAASALKIRFSTKSSTVPYFSVSHKITPKLTAGGMVQWQFSTIEGGPQSRAEAGWDQGRLFNLESQSGLSV